MTDNWCVQKITRTHAEAISKWRYPEPYSLYDSSPEEIEWLLDPANDYHAIVDSQGELVAFCCFGHDARVPGGSYGTAEDGPMDWGGSMRPDLVGNGAGRGFFELICEEAGRRWPGRGLRTTIAAFNERSQSVVRRLGFQEVEIFRNPSNREFVVYVRP